MNYFSVKLKQALTVSRSRIKLKVKTQKGYLLYQKYLPSSTTREIKLNYVFIFPSNLETK